MKYFLYLCGRMIYNLITSLPMVVCLFWGITFFFRCFRHSDEPRAQRNILLFFIVATILYFDHWLYFSGKVYTAGEWSYGVANLCVYPLYYAYLRALTRSYAREEELGSTVVTHSCSDGYFPFSYWSLHPITD